MEIEQKNIPISDLATNDGQIPGLPANPREIADDRFEALKKSIIDAPTMLCMRELLVYPYKGKYVIVGGNMRYRACVQIGYKELPCKIIPEHFTPTQLREITIKDNEGFGRNDWDKLASEWNFEELKDWGMSMPDDWAAAEGGVPDGESGEAKVVEDDDFDEDNDDVPARCSAGDVWQCGEHRLICGDSTQVAVLQKLLSNDLADMFLTDPHYNVDYVGKTKDALKIANDKLENSAFRQFLHDAFTAADKVMKPGAAFYIWHADSEGYNFRGACGDVEWKVRECLIWNKNSMVMGRQDYQWKHEPCLYGWKDGAAHNWYSDRSQTTVLDFPRPNRNDMHPTMKPVPLFAYLIQNSSKEGDIVLDTFGGSGTTLVACEQLNRKARVAELDPHYCDVIIARWEKLTNRIAVKL